jgi:uncharacterized protein (TIGR00645 family)
MQKINSLIRNIRFGHFIFFSRWLQAPLYLGLIAVQCVYVYQFIRDLFELIIHAPQMDEAHIMLAVLALIDVVMVANLLIMVIVGGYDVFVSRLKIDKHPDKPEWLDHVNAGTMKIKLAVSLIGISSIHLLQTFINPERVPGNGVMWQVIIHLTFVVSALLMAFTDRLMSKTHQAQHHSDKMSTPS